MGLGKTLEVLLGIQLCRPVPKSILVVCPASAIPVWQQEIREFGVSGADVRVISYNAAVRHKLGVMDLLVADEAHYVKNVSAKRTRAVLGAAKRAKRAWLVSGTPMPNTPDELWAPVKALWPGATDCKRKWEWVDRYCNVEDSYWGQTIQPGVKNAEHLKDLLRHFMLRRRHEDVGLELPPLRVDVTWLPKVPELEDLTSKYRSGLDPGAEIYSTTLRRLLGMAKAVPIAEQIVEELTDNAYEATVVLYHHHAVRDRLLAVFEAAGLSVTGFDGSASVADRKRAVGEFQQGRHRIFLAQQTAAGVAVTLTRSHEIVLVEPDYVPGVNRQAIARIHRIGQENPCRARIFASYGTLDHRIMWRAAGKEEGQEAVALN